MSRRLNTPQTCDICGRTFMLESPGQLRCKGECAREGKRRSTERSNARRRERYFSDPEYRQHILDQARDNFSIRYWLNGLREQRMEQRRSDKGLTEPERSL